MAQPSSEAVAQAFIQSRDQAPMQEDPSALKELKDKVSHDQLCDTMHQQYQVYDDKLEDDLSSIAVAAASQGRTPQPN